MTRSYLATDIIVLPRLSVSDAVALATALLARATDAGELPAPIRKAVDQTTPRLSHLRDLVRGNAETQSLSPAVLRSADRDLDAAWAALSDFTKAFARLPLEANQTLAADSRSVRDALFYDGLRFLQRKFREQWVESQTRLDIIESRALGDVIERLGGSTILATIRQAHDRYGEVLGITAEAVERGPSVVADALSALRDGLRRYVLQVAAHVDPDDPATQALAESLLEPLARWQDAPAAGNRNDSPIGDESGDDAPVDDGPIGDEPLDGQPIGDRPPAGVIDGALDSYSNGGSEDAAFVAAAHGSRAKLRL